MCSTYTLSTRIAELAEVFGDSHSIFQDSIEGRFTVNQMAPVIVNHGVQTMNFSLIPSWSRERRIKFATHNARLMSEDGLTPIFKKPTWKIPFLENHCIVPISQFVEPIYTGEYAGNMIRFFGDRFQFAAGITDTWVDKETGEVINSFSILTDDPVDFVAKAGHDRTPVFINTKAAKDWLSLKEKPEALIHFLKSNRQEPNEWKIEIDRPMKPGWEKRIPS